VNATNVFTSVDFQKMTGRTANASRSKDEIARNGYTNPTAVPQ
jgi:hypothetical protein